MTTYQELRQAGAEDVRSLVKMDCQGDRVTLTLSEPERLNRLSAGLNVQLQQRLQEIAWDPTFRSVVITGQDPAFSAGGDLEMIREGNRAIRDPSHPADTTDPWRWIRRQFGGWRASSPRPTSSLWPRSTVRRLVSGSRLPWRAMS